ncbi:MAG: caspase family protein [Candidatus Thiodiazotropha sp. (ex Monitilora ramsayi)]|nr:caspase family protein [Candidatus Thiodiazotropha sp. (ex Monitilora ramsayi)]
MKRRTFLSASGATLASILLPKLSLAEPANRAAIVIGVDRSGSLPVLRAAALGASAFADWLDNEGFDVERFIDGTNAKVKVDPIFEAVNRIVTRGIYEQLVIYFSGHGFLNSYRELWMLSDAPDNPNQAVSLLECERLCKRTGIPNVVFISDACRSTATSLAADSVRGSVIFPTSRQAGNVMTKVDKFLATQEGDPAYEVGVDTAAGNYYGIYTASFLDAYKVPEDEMVSVVGGVEVILNRDLEDYLRRDVNRRAQQVSIALEQRPETNVLSDKYIGRVRRTANTTVDLPPSNVSITEVTALAFAEKGFTKLASVKSLDTAQIQRSDKVKAFDQAKHRIKIAESQAPKSFETETGLFVSGIGVAEVMANPDYYRAEIAPEKGPGTIRLHPRRGAPASVAIRFSDGSGTVVAALAGYIGTVVVDGGRVVSVTYTRSGSGHAGSPEERRLKELRRLVATSARFGTFRITGSGQQHQEGAEELADRIRVMKGVDPTLGVYAAYAYADADLEYQIHSVRDFMQHDINGQIFDVALLADMLADLPPNDRRGIAPFCPMLSQGWGLLRIANVDIPREIDMARDYIEPALWTTFRRKGMDLVIEAIESGRVI